MVDPRVVRRKLIRYLGELEEFNGIDYGRYEEDSVARRAVERLIQLIVEAATDINAHIIVDEGQEPPKGMSTSFIDMGEIGVPVRCPGISPTDPQHLLQKVPAGIQCA